MDRGIRGSEKGFVHFMDMSASLVHYADERLSDETEEPLPISPADKITKFVRPALLIAALLIAGFYLPRAWVDREKVENELAAITEPIFKMSKEPLLWTPSPFLPKRSASSGRTTR